MTMGWKDVMVIFSGCAKKTSPHFHHTDHVLKENDKILFQKKLVALHPSGDRLVEVKTNPKSDI